MTISGTGTFTFDEFKILLTNDRQYIISKRIEGLEMVVGLLLVIVGILLCYTGIGALIGVPIAVVGLMIFLLGILKGGFDAICSFCGGIYSFFSKP